MNIANGIWICPGGEAKQFKNEDLDIRWYPTTKSITVSGNLENEIKEKLHSLASMSKQLLVNAEINEEAPDHDDHNDKNTNRSFVKDDLAISLELLQKQLKTLSKEVEANSDAAKLFTEHTNCYRKQQATEHELENLKRENLGLVSENTQLKILNDNLQKRVRNAEDERDSLTTAMRLLFEES